MTTSPTRTRSTRPLGKRDRIWTVKLFRVACPGPAAHADAAVPAGHDGATAAGKPSSLWRRRLPSAAYRSLAE